MNKNNQKLILGLILFAAAVVACSFPAAALHSVNSTPAVQSAPQSQNAVPEAQPYQAPNVAGGAPGQGGGGEVYPTTPEGVIQEFLSVYQLDPSLMQLYLSNQRLNAMPQGGAVELAGLHGLLQGFGVLTASVSLQPPEAMVKVALRLDGVDSIRTFMLIQQNGQWMIDAIELN